MMHGELVSPLSGLRSIALDQYSYRLTLARCDPAPGDSEQPRLEFGPRRVSDWRINLWFRPNDDNSSYATLDILAAIFIGEHSDGFFARAVARGNSLDAQLTKISDYAPNLALAMLSQVKPAHDQRYLVVNDL